MNTLNINSLINFIEELETAATFLESIEQDTVDSDSGLCGALAELLEEEYNRSVYWTLVDILNCTRWEECHVRECGSLSGGFPIGGVSEYMDVHDLWEGDMGAKRVRLARWAAPHVRKLAQLLRKADGNKEAITEALYYELDLNLYYIKCIKDVLCLVE